MLPLIIPYLLTARGFLGKHWLKVAGAAAAAALLFFVWHKIDDGGYQRCQQEYAAAAQKRDESARTKIIEVEKRYDAAKEKIRSAAGGDTLAGPLTVLAIDSLPSPSSGGR